MMAEPAEVSEVKTKLGGPRAMRISDIMIQDVKICRIDDTLNAAAQVLWDHRCGCVPVLERNSRVAGMLTDRDISMAAYTQGKMLGDMTVRSAMSKPLHFARPEDSVQTAEEIMKRNKVHRLPILDAEGNLVGIISLGDIARAALRQREELTRERGEAEVGRVLAAFCGRRSGQKRARTPRGNGKAGS
jgi:CBS domain-containing protein